MMAYQCQRRKNDQENIYLTEIRPESQISQLSTQRNIKFRSRRCQANEIHFLVFIILLKRAVIDCGVKPARHFSRSFIKLVPAVAIAKKPVRDSVLEDLFAFEEEKNSGGMRHC